MQYLTCLESALCPLQPQSRDHSHRRRLLCLKVLLLVSEPLQVVAPLKDHNADEYPTNC